uniref:DUF885 family protein n=1 Tax=Candidatus Limnocylindrus sp. TaxID=2802978 RepID=UPI00404BA1D2
MIDALDAAGLLARFAALHPVAATGMGFHDHDGSWGANGPAGRAARLDWCDREEGRLIAIPVASLSADDLCDRDLALGTIRAIRFELQEVQPEAWDALHTVSVIGGGLFPLIARGFGTAERRASDLASRLAAVPDLLDAAIVLANEIAKRPLKREDKRSGLEKFLEGNPITRNIIFKKAKEMVDRQTNGNYPAPYEIMECVKVGMNSGEKAGYAEEVKRFEKLI